MNNKTWILIGVIIAIILILSWLFLGSDILEKEELSNSISGFSNLS